MIRAKALSLAACVMVVCWACVVCAQDITPSGIVIHHSALSAKDLAQFPGPADASVINVLHQKRGFGTICHGRVYHIAYQYVILPNGTIQSGRPENCEGAHTLGHNDTLGICLIGNFSTLANPDGQLGRISAALRDVTCRAGCSEVSGLSQRLGNVFSNRFLTRYTCRVRKRLFSCGINNITKTYSIHFSGVRKGEKSTIFSYSDVGRLRRLAHL